MLRRLVVEFVEMVDFGNTTCSKNVKFRETIRMMQKSNEIKAIENVKGLSLVLNLLYLKVISLLVLPLLLYGLLTNTTKVEKLNIVHDVDKTNPGALGHGDLCHSLQYVCKVANKRTQESKNHRSETMRNTPIFTLKFEFVCFEN